MLLLLLVRLRLMLLLMKGYGRLPRTLPDARRHGDALRTSSRKCQHARASGYQHEQQQRGGAPWSVLMVSEEKASDPLPVDPHPLRNMT